MALRDKAAAITGAGSGFGRATARLFAERGANVVAVDIDADALAETASLAEADGSPGTVVTAEADVSDGDDVAAFVQATVDEFGRIDVLHNNAGVIHDKTPVTDLTDDQWHRVIDVNLKSIFLGAKYVVPHMREQDGGAIVNTASIAGHRPRDQLSAYVASKGGVHMLTKALAMELAADDIRVNSVSPVASPTSLLDDFSEEDLQAMADTIPLGRMADPRDIAQAAAFLGDDETAGLITGADIPVDGGRGI